MEPFVAAILIGLPLAWLVGFAVYAYVDAPKYGMNPKKWAAVSFGIPLFGFFAYLFERSETEYDPEADPYAQGQQFDIHESRRGEELIDPGGDDQDVRRTPNDEHRDTGDEDDEWNDPPSVDG
ncbi:MAG: hypothetical protein PPP55_01185 [Halorubrum sp.]